MLLFCNGWRLIKQNVRKVFFAHLGNKMNKKLKFFIECEQRLNNYNLYEEKEWKDFFNINIADEYKPENRVLFKLPYFLIPIGNDKFLFEKEYYDFFEYNLKHDLKNQNFYPFFIHPSTEKMFLSWVNNKYEFIDSEKSEYVATPSSSYRSLIVNNENTNQCFMVKCSIFDNIANGARHIDWKSASGQFEQSKIVTSILSNSNINLEVFKDIGAFGISGEYPMILSNRFKIKFGSRYISTLGNVIRMMPNDFINNDNRIISFASYMSLLDKDSFLSRGYKNSGETFQDFFEHNVFNPLFQIILELLVKTGVSLEFHCQNTLLEINEKNIPTGKFYYRDFDLVALDRARFPFIFPKLWNSYIRNRPDRTTLYANTSAREDIGINLFNHFLDNLIRPCLISAEKNNIITKNVMNEMYNKHGQTIKCAIKELMPKVQFYDEKYYCFGQEMFSKIHKKEIPVDLKKVNSFEVENSDERIRLWKKTDNIDFDYYKTPKNDVLCFQGDILIQII